MDDYFSNLLFYFDYFINHDDKIKLLIMF